MDKVFNSKRQTTLIVLIVAVNAGMYFFEHEQSNSIGIIFSTMRTNLIVLVAVLGLYLIWARIDRNKKKNGEGDS